MSTGEIIQLDYCSGQTTWNNKFNLMLMVFQNVIRQNASSVAQITCDKMYKISSHSSRKNSHLQVSQFTQTK